ncbi:MAG: peptidylprolyl isomerase [Anaerolineae bacterium]|nr:peptidylprolyl isomerase [Anaerolineae bacterium]
MRSYNARLPRWGWLAANLVVVSLLLAACAGGGSDSSSDAASNNNPTAADQTQLVSVGPENGDSDAGAPQVAGEPTPTAAESLAALVNGEPVTMTAFERERERRALGMDIQPATAAAFDAMVIQSMIDQLLINQAAAREGIAITDEEVDAELTVQAEIASQNNLSLEQVVAEQLYTMDEYREAIRNMLLWYEVSQTVVANMPTTSTQVHARHILVADETTAWDLLTQLDQGADFAELAVTYSLDTSTGRSGGDLDWVSRGDLLQPEVEDAIFALEPGARSAEPVVSSLGYHIIEVLERVNDRPLDQAKLAERREQVFLDWLDIQRQSADIIQYVGTNSQ